MVQTKEIYNGRYTIYSDGRVYSNMRKKFLKPLFDGNYYNVCLYENYKDKYKRFLVHRLIAIYFIDNPLKLPAVDHIDNIKTNNDVSNLQWISNRNNNLKKYNSEFPGVSYHKRDKKYQATIRHNGKQIYLGYYETQEKAHAVYMEYKKKHNLL